MPIWFATSGVPSSILDTFDTDTRYKYELILDTRETSLAWGGVPYL